jgi:hypothetical protein
MAAAAASVLAVGCECTEVGCAIGADQGVRVVVTGAGQTYSGDLPATFHLCVDATCADFTMAEKGGQLACDDGEKDGEPDLRACFLLNGQDLELVLATAMPNASSQVGLTVHTADGTVLFDQKTTVQVATYEPNGAMCGPTCRTAEAKFSPPPASQ